MTAKGRRQSGQAARGQSAEPRAASPAPPPPPPVAPPRPPWELARPDPPDLPAADFVLTVWVEASFPPDAAGLHCSLEWFAEPKGAIGAVGSWSEVSDGVSEEVVAEEPRLTRTRFEKASPAQKGTCAFLRQLAEELLQVRVQLAPDPAASAPPASAGRSAPPAAAGRKGKNAAAPAAAAPAAAPAAAAPSPPPPDEGAVVALQLAPLLLPGPGGSPPEASAELAGAAARRLGLASLRVGVTCSRSTLSEEIAAHLNPMLLTLESASKLPCDDPAAAEASGRVYATAEAFGQQLRTAPCELRGEGRAEFWHQKVFFVGTWPAREFQAFLRANALRVAVHDRDTAVPLRPQPPKASPQASPEASPLASHPGKSPSPDAFLGGQGAAAGAAAQAAAEERARDKEAQAAGIRGLASFALRPLLRPPAHGRPQPGEPMRLRAPLRPSVTCCREAPAGAGVGGAAVLLGEGGREALASREGRRRRLAPGYLEAGSAVALAVRLARPGQAPWAPLPAAAGQEATAKVQHPCTEPFARAVVVHGCRDGALLKQLHALIADHNVAAMGLDPAQYDASTLASVEVTDEQCSNPELDILTGFIATDRSQRVIVLEGLRDGAMQKVAGALEVGLAREPGRRVLFSPTVAFDRRLYGKLGLTLKYIKLRTPELETLTVRPGLCINSGGDEAACALHCLAEMRRAERMHALVGSFPLAGAVLALETQYGTFVSDEELAGDVFSASASAASRRTSKGSKRPQLSEAWSSAAPNRKGGGAAAPSSKVAAWTSSTRKPINSTLPAQLVPLGGLEPMYSFNVAEPFREVPGSSEYLDAYMMDIGRPVVLPALATSPRKKVPTAVPILPGAEPASKKTSFSSAPMSARRARASASSWVTSAESRGPMSARAR